MGVPCAIEKQRCGKSVTWIDAKEPYRYLWLTKSRIGLWECCRKLFFDLGAERDGRVSILAADQQSPRRGTGQASGLATRPSVVLFLLKARTTAQWAKPIRELQDLRAMVMTKKQRESTGGNPPSGQHKPEMPVLAPFTPPRKNSNNTFRREKKYMGRTSHGSARAIEGLRGVRMSLVPRPGGRKGVLQGV